MKARAFQVTHRRQATIAPARKRILNSNIMTAHTGRIRWASVPAFFPNYMIEA